MGKIDNIKRAKRLKEAKRKREQDVLIAAGLGPVSKIVQERSVKKGIETRLNNGKVKYSALLKEFVHPIVGEQDDISIVKTKYMFGAHAWNAATLREKSEEVYQLAKKEITKIIPDAPEVEQLFDEFKTKTRRIFRIQKYIHRF